MQEARTCQRQFKVVDASNLDFRNPESDMQNLGPRSPPRLHMTHRSKNAHLFLSGFRVWIQNSRPVRPPPPPSRIEWWVWWGLFLIGPTIRAICSCVDASTFSHNSWQNCFFRLFCPPSFPTGMIAECWWSRWVAVREGHKRFQSSLTLLLEYRKVGHY